MAWMPGQSGKMNPKASALGKLKGFLNKKASSRLAPKKSPIPDMEAPAEAAEPAAPKPDFDEDDMTLLKGRKC